MTGTGPITAVLRESQYPADARKTYVEQPGLEVVPTESHKEYIRNDDYPEVVPKEPELQKKRYHRLTWIMVALVVVASLAIGLGVGLGLGLRHKG